MNTQTPLPQRQSYQAYGRVRTRPLDLILVSLHTASAEGHVPPFEWPLTSHVLVFTDGPFQPTATTHRGIASTAASTSAKPHVSTLMSVLTIVLWLVTYANHPHTTTSHLSDRVPMYRGRAEYPKYGEPDHCLLPDPLHEGLEGQGVYRNRLDDAQSSLRVVAVLRMTRCHHYA